MNKRRGKRGRECNLEQERREDKDLDDMRELPSIYIGESSRSLKQGAL